MQPPRDSRRRCAGGARSAPRENLDQLPPPPATVLGLSALHAPGTVERTHVTAGTSRVTVCDETAELITGDSCNCRTDAPHGIATPDPSAEAVIKQIVSWVDCGRTWPPVAIAGAHVAW